MPTDDGALNATTQLLAGAALYNSGRYHTAHDPWEAVWLTLEPGADHAFFQGLIQTTAAVHHAREGNPEGSRGLARSAREYLSQSALGDHHRGVALEPLRTFLHSLERDQTVTPPRLAIEGEVAYPSTLPFGALAVAATEVAEADGLDEGVVARAVEYGRADVDAGRASSPFVELLVAVVEGRGHRTVVLQRLREHVERRDHEERDVEGLFDVADEREE